MHTVTVAGADSADALYREGAVLLDVDRGEIFCNDQHHRIADLLDGASLVLVYGARSVRLDEVVRLFEGWDLPAWKLVDTDVDELRQRIIDAPRVGSQT